MSVTVIYTIYREKKKKRERQRRVSLSLSLSLAFGCCCISPQARKPAEFHAYFVCPMHIGHEHKGPFREGEEVRVKLWAKGWTHIPHEKRLSISLSLSLSLSRMQQYLLLVSRVCLFCRPTVVKSHTNFYCFYLRGNTVRTNGDFSFFSLSLSLSPSLCVIECICNQSESN